MSLHYQNSVYYENVQRLLLIFVNNKEVEVL